MQWISASAPAYAMSMRQRTAGIASLTGDPPRARDGLLSFYGREGGVVTSDQLAFMLIDRVDEAISLVARWIGDRRLVCLDDGAQRLLPMFQFDLAQARIHPAVESAVTHLRSTMDDAAIASWFAMANVQLGHQAPAQAIRQGSASVDQAARLVSRLRAL